MKWFCYALLVVGTDSLKLTQDMAQGGLPTALKMPQQAMMVPGASDLLQQMQQMQLENEMRRAVRKQQATEKKEASKKGVNLMEKSYYGLEKAEATAWQKKYESAEKPCDGCMPGLDMPAELDNEDSSPKGATEDMPQKEWANLRESPDGITLRKWIQDKKCLNVGLAPWETSHWAQMGALDALKDEGLMEKVTGLSGSSMGALISAIAASPDQKEASLKWRNFMEKEAIKDLSENKVPVGPFATMVPESKANCTSDPCFSDMYKSMLNTFLPETFEELKIPLGVTAEFWKKGQTELDSEGLPGSAIIVSDGNLADMLSASSSGMVGEGCPNCKYGNKGKNIKGFYPVFDSFRVDMYGTAGLHAVPPCDNLLHLLHMQYPRQYKPYKLKVIDTEPKNGVTVTVDVAASHPLGFKREYSDGYEAMEDLLDKPMLITPEENHYFADMNMYKRSVGYRPPKARQTDMTAHFFRQSYWDGIEFGRNSVTATRNVQVREGKLSYRKGGKGYGAPGKDGEKPQKQKAADSKDAVVETAVEDFAGFPMGHNSADR